MTKSGSRVFLILLVPRFDKSKGAGEEYSIRFRPHLYGRTYTSVLPMMAGLAYRSVGSSVTTANGSEVPLNAPATFVNPVALIESCSFIVLPLKIFCRIGV